MNPPLWIATSPDWAVWIFQAGLTSLALGLTGSLAATITRRAHPALRSLVLANFLTAATVAVVAAFPFVEARRQVMKSATATGSHANYQMEEAVKVLTSAASQHAAADALAEVSTNGLETQEPWPLPAISRPILMTAGGIWMAGSLMVFILTIPGWRRLRKWRSQAVPGPPFEGIPVFRSAGCPQPMCGGLFRPVILLPAWFADLPEPQQTAVLRHEAAHIRHGDLWLLRLQILTVALHWWNPFLRRLNRQLTASLEERADLAVLRAGISATDYAQCLLDCAARLAGKPALPPPSLAMAASAATVRTRISALLTSGLPVSPSRARRGLCLLAALAAALAPPFLIPSPVFASSGAEEPASTSSPAKPEIPSTQPAAIVEESDPADKSAATSAAAAPASIPPSTPIPIPTPTPSPPSVTPPENQPPTAAGDEALRRLLEAGDHLFERPRGKKAKSGAPPVPAVKLTADQIVFGAQDFMILRGNVRITFPGGTLEADLVEMQPPSKISPKESPKAPALKATGKFVITLNHLSFRGLREDSTFVITNDGSYTSTGGVVRVEGPKSPDRKKAR